MIAYTLRQNSAEVSLYFLLVKSSDHITGLAGLAPASITVTICKNALAFTAPAGAIFEVGKGVYCVAPNAADTSAPGVLWLHAEAPGADPCDTLYLVIMYNAYDALALGLGALPEVAIGAAGGLPTVDAANGVKLSVGTGTGQVSLAAGKLAATLGAADYATNTPQSGDAFARLGANGAGLTALAPAATALSSATWTTARATNLDALGSGGAGLTAVAPAATALSSATWTTARATNLDRLDVAVSTRSTYAGADTAGTTAALALLTGLVVAGDHTQFTAHALATAPTGGGGTDPWTIALPGGYAAGTAGAILGGRLDVAVSTRSTYAGADTAGTTTLLARLTDPRATNLDHLDAAVSSRSTYAGTDTPGTTTLLARLTVPRAANLDNLDAAVSTRSTYAGGPVAAVTAPVSISLAQVLAAPRNVGAVADGSVQLNDALWAAVCGAAGKESVAGTTYLVMTPSTGTTLRSFTLDNPSSPTSRT